MGVYLRPGANVGAPAIAEMEPPSEYFNLDNGLVTGSKTQRRFKPVIRRHPLLRADVATVLVALCAALGVVQFYRPEAALGGTPFARLGGAASSLGSASDNAFGRSGEVKLLFALPGQKIEFPLAVGGDPTSLTYEWTSLRGVETGFASHPIEGADIATPSVPGFYYLTLVHGGDRQIISQPAVAIMRPFEEKLGSMLNGYRIGTYLAEKLRGGVYFVSFGVRRRPFG